MPNASSLVSQQLSQVVQTTRSAALPYEALVIVVGIIILVLGLFLRTRNKSEKKSVDNILLVIGALVILYGIINLILVIV